MAIKINKNGGIVISDLDTLYIDGVAFKGISPESQLGYYETVWATNLSRNNDFAFENIDDVDMGKVAQLQITFKIIDYETYLQLQQLLQQRHVMVDYFNVDLGKRVCEEMAITNNERKRLYNFGSRILGMRDVSFKMVGTNRNIDSDDDLTIIYYDNVNNSSQYDDSGVRYEQYKVINKPSDFINGSKMFLHWNTKPDDSGMSYYPTQSITLWSDMVLYAIWG